MMNEHFLDVVKQIRLQWSTDEYDHLPYLPKIEGIDKWNGGEVFRKRYAAFKHTVAKVIKPRSVVEIGVGFGVAACAFINGAGGTCSYCGFDDGSMDERSLPAVSETLKQWTLAKVHHYESLHIPELDRVDLFHVDGAHDYAHAFADVQRAMKCALWVLIDDTRDSQVAAAAMQALYIKRPGNVNWCSFEDSFSGDILLYMGDEP